MRGSASAILTCIIREKWRSDEFFIETIHIVTRAEFASIASLISKRLVQTKSGFWRITTHLCQRCDKVYLRSVERE